MHGKTDRTTVALVALALVGAVSVLLATRWGIGVTTDSISYIDAARHIAAGDGVVTSIGGRPHPMTHWPPGYPLLLAVPGLAGIDPLVGARWLGALLMAGTILLAGLMTRRFAEGAGWAALLAGWLVLTSRDVLRIHISAWSEPMFVFLGLLGLYLLSRYAEENRPVYLLGAALPFAVALLARYVGAGYVAAGVLVVLLFTRRSLWGRLVDAAMFWTLSCLPMLIWLGRNLAVRGRPTDRSLRWHTPGMEKLKEALETISHWFVPRQLPIAVGVALGALVAGGLTTGVIVLWRRGGEAARARLRTLGVRLFPFAAFGLCYLGLLLTAMIFSDPGLEFDNRMASPIAPLLFIVGLPLIHVVMTGLGARRGHWVALAVGLGLFGTFYFLRQALQVRRQYVTGRAYMRREWQTSPTLEFIRSLSPDVPVYTLTRGGIHLHTGRRTRAAPRKYGRRTGALRSGYPREMSELRRRMAAEGGKLIFIGADAPEDHPPEQYERFGFRLVEEFRDGMVYEAVPEARNEGPQRPAGASPQPSSSAASPPGSN